MQQLNWPPPFELLNSVRAKSVSLKICYRRGLQLIVPRRFNLQRIPFILEQHRRWILRHWHHLENAHASGKQSVGLPQKIKLWAIGEEWSIQYDEDKNKKDNNPTVIVETVENAKMIIIRGNITDNAIIFSVLKKWLKHKAKQHLVTELNKVSKITCLSYYSLSIRDARTRWGSCSAKKNISLNFKLLFLPLDIVQYILLHELCHTVHLNHSKHFWKLLEKFCPEYERARRELKQVSRYIPLWLES